VRLGHPDVERAMRRYAKRWKRQVLVAAGAGLIVAILAGWLVLGG
jgi:multisubunit Na+/H+ antiporter MnhB subunit